MHLARRTPHIECGALRNETCWGDRIAPRWPISAYLRVSLLDRNMPRSKMRVAFPAPHHAKLHAAWELHQELLELQQTKKRKVLAIRCHSGSPLYPKAALGLLSQDRNQRFDLGKNLRGVKPVGGAAT